MSLFPDVEVLRIEVNPYPRILDKILTPNDLFPLWLIKTVRVFVQGSDEINGYIIYFLFFVYTYCTIKFVYPMVPSIVAFENDL